MNVNDDEKEWLISRIHRKATGIAFTKDILITYIIFIVFIILVKSIGN